MSDHPATGPGAREGHPVRIAPRGGLSSLDARAHTIDKDADHHGSHPLAGGGFRGTDQVGGEEPPERQELDGEAPKASRLVRLETGSSVEAVLARWVPA